jgi:hypothetical protein
LGINLDLFEQHASKKGPLKRFREFFLAHSGDELNDKVQNSFKFICIGILIVRKIVCEHNQGSQPIKVIE